MLTAPLLLLGCGDNVPAFRNTDITGTQIDGAFFLDDFHGRPQKLANFRGKVIILFFGYTSCPDICPTALAKFAALMQRPEIDPARVQVIFITLDPERDTAERLRDYVPWFHPGFIGLRGDAATIADVSRQFRVTSLKKAVPGEMGYVIDHSAGAYVFGPDGRLRLYLAENAQGDAIAADVVRLLAGA
jgi:protein SCO1/2